MAKKNTEETAVVTAQETAVAKPMGKGRGFERINPEDITLPRIKLLQSNSPEVADRDLDVRAGDFFHNVMMEKVEELIFLPLSIMEDKTFMVPRNDNEKKEAKERLGLTDDDMDGLFICRAVDGKHGDRFGSCVDCGLCEFDNINHLKPLCNKNVKVLAWFPQYGIPAVLIFTSTSFKYGKKFKDMAFMTSAAAGEDLFSRAYKLCVKDEKNNKGSWFGMEVKPAGKATQEHFETAEQMFNMFSGVSLDSVVDDGAPAEPAAPANTEY